MVLVINPNINSLKGMSSLRQSSNRLSKIFRAHIVWNKGK